MNSSSFNILNTGYKVYPSSLVLSDISKAALFLAAADETASTQKIVLYEYDMSTGTEIGQYEDTNKDFNLCTSVNLRTNQEYMVAGCQRE